MINQLKPSLLELIFDELLKDPGYKSIGAIIPGSHLEIAKGIIQKLDANAEQFPTLFKAILNGVASNIAPLAATLTAMAKKVKNSDESAYLIGLIDKAKQERLAAVKASMEAQKMFLMEYAQKSKQEAVQAASDLYWFDGSPARLAPRDFRLENDSDLKNWLSTGFKIAGDLQQTRQNLTKVLKHYLAADDATRIAMGQAFAYVLNNMQGKEDLFDIIDNLDDELRIAVFRQLLEGEDARGFVLIQKYWKHEAKNAGLRGKTLEELALRRMALAMHYLNNEQPDASLNSDSFWGILSTYPLLAAVGLSKDALGRLAQSIREPVVKSLRSDLPNIIARIVVSLDEDRPDVYAAMLRIANYASDTVVAEALIQKFKAIKPKLVKMSSARDADEAERLLMDAIKDAKKL